MDLIRGQRIRLQEIVPFEQFIIELTVKSPGLTIDFSCFGLDGAYHLSDERYLIFYNQTETPCRGVCLSDPVSGGNTKFVIDLNKLPKNIEKLVFTAAIDGQGVMSSISYGHVRFLNLNTTGSYFEFARFNFNNDDFTQERALMLIEIYIKSGQWRVHALGQGFNGGLEALVKHFGGEILESSKSSSSLDASLSSIDSSTDTSGKLCKRCKKKFGFFGGLLSYNNKTKRCGDCDNEVELILNKIRRDFLDHATTGNCSADYWQSLKNYASHENVDWLDVSKFILDDIVKFLKKRLDKYLNEGILTDEKERNFLNLCQQVELPRDTLNLLLASLNNIKKITRLAYLEQTLKNYMFDGVVTYEKERDFLQLCQQYSLPSNDHALLISKFEDIKKKTRLAYLEQQLSKYAYDGFITDEKERDFLRLCQQYTLPSNDHALLISKFEDIKRKTRLTHLEKTLAIYASDGIITDEEERDFNLLCVKLNLPKQLTSPLLDRLSYLKKITKIRQGFLDTIQTNAHLESDEICHLETNATYHKKTPKGIGFIQGRLLASNKKLHFLSNMGGWVILWKNIMKITCEGSCVVLELTTKQGNGKYQVADPVLTEAMLTTITKVAKRQILNFNDDQQNRHIPRDVKITVWQRDQGKCVQCSANTYLEFDHIIPFSKGGANTVNNIQLLCRKCNLQKGDRL